MIDLSANRPVYKAGAKSFEDRVGLDQIDFFSSEEGITLYKDHEYEVVSTYDNTSGKPVDAMAVMYLYMLDNPAPSDASDSAASSGAPVDR